MNEELLIRIETLIEDAMTKIDEAFPSYDDGLADLADALNLIDDAVTETHPTVRDWLRTSEIDISVRRKAYETDELTMRLSPLSTSTLKLLQDDGYEFLWAGEGCVVLDRGKMSATVDAKNGTVDHDIL